MGENGEYEINHDTDAVILGDVAISMEKAVEQAYKYDHSLEREIGFLTAHSVLHLLGYDHEQGGLDRVRMREREDGSGITDIEGTIYCERESHKAIIIGKKGSMLKKVGSLARSDMERFFDCKINLQLWVKVKEDWRNRQNILHSLGYDKTNFDT